MRFQYLVIFLLVLLASAARNQAKPGGYSPIKNLNDPHVIEIANFAVTEYGKQQRFYSKLDKIIKGESQAVDGTNYRFILYVIIGSESYPYKAFVHENASKSFKKLISFVSID
ncbi:putative Cystatin domain-containing protein [Medicago truncatula]|uniref:Cysteine proteinase inhibitor n=1 Tax=Medicago truncatula TaxID=3880 RepID=G7IH77_MEDTR|nr:cysteine proteinase inhibitor 5 [Medicago truncatula]AES66642.1 cysteine proteinase inhibitor [Medicago truncatula]RHN74956.1 putative Cystatin domain-containing protein [Medicago truncatula]